MSKYDRFGWGGSDKPDFEIVLPQSDKVVSNSLEEALSKVTIDWIE